MNRIDARALENDVVDVAASRLPPPLLTWIGDGRWRLETDYAYRDGEAVITAPAGFQFDLSSVPRVLWWLIAPFELSIAAPLLHDFLYLYGASPPAGSIEPPRTYTRAEADRLFYGIMRAEGVPGWRRMLSLAAVRLFGQNAWHN